MNRAVKWVLLVVLIGVAGVAMAQEPTGGMGIDPEEMDPPITVAGTIVAMLTLAAIPAACVLGWMRFRRKANPAARLYGDLRDAPLVYSAGAVRPMRSALIPGRRWWQTLILLAIVLASALVLNRLLTGPLGLSDNCKTVLVCEDLDE